MVRVLLVSPTDPKKPKNLKFLVGGEATFTKTLLENPPRGVIYIHHLEAFKKGLISYLPSQKIFAFLVKLRILPLSSGTQAFEILNYFDLIHCHGYSIKIKDPNVPIILSDSSSNYIFLKDYIGWAHWQIEIAYKFRKWIFDKFGVIDPDTNLEKASLLIVFSQFAKKIHQKLGIPKNKIEVIYPGLPTDYPRASDPVSEKFYETGSEIIRILFVGIWFERKGGRLVVEAFRRLSKKYKNIKLTVIGPIPKDLDIKDLNLENRDFVPRGELLRKYFPAADIFVLVPPRAEGFGFSVLEAMSFGVPTIVTRICALPELVEDKKTGFVIKPGSLDQLVEKLEILIKNQSIRGKMGKAARNRFLEKFSIEKSNSELLKVYRQVLSKN